jgi:hypothetical protein
MHHALLSIVSHRVADTELRAFSPVSSGRNAGGSKTNQRDNAKEISSYRSCLVLLNTTIGIQDSARDTNTAAAYRGTMQDADKNTSRYFPSSPANARAALSG